MVVVPWEVIGSVTLLVTVTVALQLSVAVGDVRDVISHSAIISVRVATSGVGAVLSTTLTVAVQVSVFPLPSSTVKVTVLLPKFAHVKAVWDKLKPIVPLPQIVEPLSMSLPNNVAFPLASKVNVKGVAMQVAVGGFVPPSAIDQPSEAIILALAAVAAVEQYLLSPPWKFTPFWSVKLFQAIRIFS